MGPTTPPRRKSTSATYGFPPPYVRLPPVRAQERAPAHVQAADELAHLGQPRAQLGVTDLDGPHRVLELRERRVRPADRLQRAVEEALHALRRRARGRRL